MSASTASRFTADGTNTGNFNRTDWALLLGVATVWGSSFLWIAIGLDAFHPGAIAFVRMVLGSIVLWMIPASRTPLPRSTWPALAVVALAGNAAPAIFFPLAQTRVESSVAGMMNSVSPVMVLLISILMTRKLPQRLQVLGLVVGLVGAILVSLPNVSGADAQPVGVLLVVVAVSGYALSNNFLPPLAQAYGGPAVVARAMTMATMVLSPYGVYGISKSSWAWPSAIAILVLGVVGTGLARSFFATLVGRVGAPRSSMVGYFVPIMAIALGIIVRGESIGALELIGTAIILCGAGLISRGRS